MTFGIPQRLRGGLGVAVKVGIKAFRDHSDAIEDSGTLERGERWGGIPGDADERHERREFG